MEINVIGGGWVTAKNHGRMRDGARPVLTAGAPVLPSIEDIFSHPPARYRRFDAYTRLGCAAISLALQDAGMAHADRERPVGIVVSSVYECFEVDLAYYETASEDGGMFASPNLFSYTLPGIVTGEAAIHFKLTGPTFTVGDSIPGRGYPALATSVDVIRTGTCETMVSGWLDSPGDLLEAKVRGVDHIRGAIFLVLSSGCKNNALTQLRIKDSDLVTASGAKLRSVLDLFE